MNLPILPKVSCICPTFNRIDKLEEMLQCFLNQDYEGPKELVILNDCPTQKLKFEHPNVKIVNSDTQYASLCKKHKALVDMTDGELITVWDDDDIKFSNAISFCVKRMKMLNTPLFYPKNTLILYDNTTYRLINSSHFHLNGMWTRELYNLVGGYSENSEFADGALQNKFLICLRDFVPIDILVSDTYAIYRVNGDVKQISFHHQETDSTSEKSKLYREMVLQKAQSGIYELQPHLEKDYETEAKEIIEQRKYVYNVYSVQYNKEENKVLVYAGQCSLKVQFFDKKTGACVYTGKGMSSDDINNNWFQCFYYDKSANFIINVYANEQLVETLDTETMISKKYEQIPNKEIVKNPLQIKDNFMSLTGKTCAEIGVLKGEFSSQIYECDPKELVLIDCWEYQAEGYVHDVANTDNDVQLSNYRQVVSMFISKPNVHIFKEYSADAVKRFADGYFDFVYIDANHGYTACLEDIKMWYPKTKSGGWLCGHDLPWDSVRNAVITFCADNKLEYKELTRDSWGIQKL